jgi:hypothetical protein
MIERDENQFGFHKPLHFLEQYLTLSQSLAHFLRHSNFRQQRSQVRGSKPFLVFGVGTLQIYATFCELQLMGSLDILINP